jgi:DNA-binding NarL/FixJ family response regulator
VSIRLLIADDHRMLREGLKALLDEEDDLTVVGEAESGVETVEQAATLRPNLVIMDVAMPGLNGIEATRKILQQNPGTRVVALSGHADRRLVRQMLCAGASAYVLKQNAYEELMRAVRQVLAGRKFLSPEVARGVVDEYVELSSPKQENAAFIVLTDREREVLQQLAEGLSTKETAARLGVSVKTVETHRRNIMDKLELHSVAELTKYAIREGVTSVDV